MSKINKIRGGIYTGRYWFDFISSKDAKAIAHKQNRKRHKALCRRALSSI